MQKKLSFVGIYLLIIAVILTGCINSDQPEDSSSMPLVADFHYYPTNLTTNDSITFICTSVDYDGTIVNRTWELGDGTTKYGKQIEHIYSNEGYYTVNLTIWDNKDQNALKSYIMYCGKNTSDVTEFKIEANFTRSPANPTTSDTIQFIDTSVDSEGTIIDWHWDFGDNTISTEQNPTHKYAQEGDYQVTLTVRNDSNAANSTTLNLTVNTDDVLGEVIIFEEQNPGDIFMSPEETGEGYWRVKTTDFLEQFYQVYDDYYDFIVLVPTKIISSSYSSGVNSNTYGIGNDPSPVDSYPYIERLKSLTAWGTYSHYYWAGNTTEYFDVESDVDIISHEIGHHWLVGLRLYKYDSPGGHWPNNLDLFSGDARYCDIMAYYHWILNGDEEICVDCNSEDVINRFSSLSLYLMGLIPPENVPPIYVHEFEERVEEGIYQYYNLWGPRCTQEHVFTDTITITIDDIIEDYGERRPSSDISQKNFRVVFVILTENGEDVPSELLEYIEQCRDALPEYWSEATLGTSKIEC